MMMDRGSVLSKTLFGAPRQSSTSLSSSSPASPSSPHVVPARKLSHSFRGGSSFPSTSLKPEGRPRSGTTVEPIISPRKRSDTLSSTVDHLTLFWEGKKDTKDKKEKEKEKEREKDKKKEREREREKEKQKEKEKEKEKTVTKSKSGSILFGKAPSRVLNIREPKESEKEVKITQHKENNVKKEATENNAKHVVVKEEKVVQKGGKEGRHLMIPEKQRAKKAKSEGSLFIAIFSKKLVDRSGILQKSSSLIDLKPAAITLPAKCGSSLQLGQIKTGYFGITLQDAMEMQKEKFPDLLIPVIVVKLTEAVIYYHGNTLEGIFRVAGSIQQVIKLQQQLNVMNYDEMPSDPHVMVGVLKQWLRELKEPLIPNANYQDCIRCETHSDSVKAVDKLPPLNKATLGHLVSFLRQIAKPENQEHTKMDLHSLCVVSAPVLFKCPSTDMAELMVNMQKEKTFLGLVLESSAFSPL